MVYSISPVTLENLLKEDQYPKKINSKNSKAEFDQLKKENKLLKKEIEMLKARDEMLKMLAKRIDAKK